MPSSSGASMNSRGNSMQIFGTQISHKLAHVGQLGKPSIDINLDNGHGKHGDYVTSYATMDTIEGTVSIKADKDTRFEDIEISFVGVSQVYVDRLTTTPSVTGRTEATHRFLTLKQPINDADLPCPRNLLAGKTYDFPFTFTVPQHLLPRACTHPVSNDHVRDSHLMLPPSMGDPELSGFGGVLLDDLAPEMSKITYAIKARISQLREADGAVYLLASKTRKVRVKPIFEEQPPMNIHPGDPDFRLRQEKNIRKGLFKGKLGTLTAQSAQPRALMIPGARTVNEKPISTVAKVLLRFDPADENSQPPRLGSLSTKLKVSTYYGSAPRQSFPTRSDLTYDLTQGVYQETISLSNLCIASAPWEKRGPSSNPSPTQNSTALPRRASDDSGISDCSTLTTDSNIINTTIPPPSPSYRGSTFYTTSITVPITCPGNKNLLPTFHTCLISRSYTLSLQLSVNAPGVTDPSLHLKLPLQIAAEGSDTGNANAWARRREAVMAREADQIFVPRSVAPPSFRAGAGVGTGLEGRNDDLPPEYAAFAPGGNGAAFTRQVTDVRVLAVS